MKSLAGGWPKSPIREFTVRPRKTPLELHAEELPHLLPWPALRFDTAQVVYRIVETDG
jgi:hypothetical protein